MCPPVALGVMAGAAVIGAGVKAYSDYRGGMYEAQVAKNNAKLAADQRLAALGEGANEAAAISAEGRATAASALTATVAGGVETTVGSPAGAITTSAINAARDAARAKTNAARQAWGFASEEQDLRSRARMIRQGSLLSAAGTGLSGVGQAASAYALYRKG